MILSWSYSLEANLIACVCTACIWSGCLFYCIGKNGDGARSRNIFLLLAIPKQCNVLPSPWVFLVADTRSYFSIRDTSYGIRASIDRFRRQDEMDREVKITDRKAPWRVILRCWGQQFVMSTLMTCERCAKHANERLLTIVPLIKSLPSSVALLHYIVQMLIWLDVIFRGVSNEGIVQH